MRKPAAFAAVIALSVAGAAQADSNVETAALGPGAAHLAVASEGGGESDDYTLRHDPSGAPMCFDASGSKVPLRACQGAEAGPEPERAEPKKVEHIPAFDPSGGPMCFDLAGNKAPLENCQDSPGQQRAAHASEVAYR